MTAPVRIEDVMEANRARTIEGLHTCEPAKVLSYDAAKQTVDVQPVNKRRYTDADTGEVFFEDKPAIPKVPVGWPMAGGFGMCMPLEAGDHVWLIYAQESISEWREADQVSEPTDAGRLTDSHPFAIPAAFPVGKEFAQTTKAGAFIGHKGGNGLHVQSSNANLKVGSTELDLSSSVAKLKSAAVELGGATNSGVATKLSMTPQDTAMKAALSALSTVVGALLPIAGPTPAQTGAATSAIGTVVGLIGTPASYSQTVKASS